MPGRKWTGEEKANIVLEILTTSTSTAEVCRRYNVRPTLVYSWRASFVQAGTRGLSGTDASHKRNKRGILLCYIHYLKPSLRFLCTFGFQLYSEFLLYGKPDLLQG